jgi:formylmethanofuran dehydrogenase subunit E
MKLPSSYSGLTEKDRDYIDAIRAIKPCTCGSNNLLLRETTEGKRYIHCHNCKRETRSYPTWGEAVEEWNRRNA